MRSIEVLGWMVASEPPLNNPYLGQAYWYRSPVACPQQTSPEPAEPAQTSAEA